MRRAALLLALLLVLAGCGTRTPAPAPTPGVRTDWSRLEPREPFVPVGSRWYTDYTDRLIPNEDYGTLIPYAGVRLSGDWYVQNGCLYGLMTANGTVVTDPVFSEIQSPGFRTGAEAGLVYHHHPLLLLTRGGGDGEKRYAVAAADGSWCSEFSYSFWSSNQDGLLLLSEDGMCLMAPDGTTTDAYTWADMGLSGDAPQTLLRQLADYGYTLWCGDYVVLGSTEDGADLRCFRRSTRQWETISYDAADRLQEQPDRGDTVELRAGETLVQRDGVTYHIPHVTSRSVYIRQNLLLFFEDGAVYTLEGETVLAPLDTGYGEFLRDDLFGDAGPEVLIYRYDQQTEQHHYYRGDGTPLPFLDDYDSFGPRQIGLCGGLLYVLDIDTASYYSYDTLDCVFRTSLHCSGD